MNNLVWSVNTTSAQHRAKTEAEVQARRKRNAEAMRCIASAPHKDAEAES